MNRLSKIATSIWTFLLVGGGLFIGLFIWGANTFMGDKFYSLQVQNDKDIKLKLKTYKITQPGDRLVVDSLVLNPAAKFEIGTSHSCSTVDTTFIWFDAIEIFDTDDKSRLFKKKELVAYLQTMEKVDCSTYLVR